MVLQMDRQKDRAEFIEPFDRVKGTKFSEGITVCFYKAIDIHYLNILKVLLPTMMIVSLTKSTSPKLLNPTKSKNISSTQVV